MNHARPTDAHAPGASRAGPGGRDDGAPGAPPALIRRYICDRCGNVAPPHWGNQQGAVCDKGDCWGYYRREAPEAHRLAALADRAEAAVYMERE